MLLAREQARVEKELHRRQADERIDRAHGGILPDGRGDEPDPGVNAAALEAAKVGAKAEVADDVEGSICLKLSATRGSYIDRAMSFDTALSAYKSKK